MKARVNPKSTSNQSSKPCTVLQYPSKKVCMREGIHTGTYYISHLSLHKSLISSASLSQDSLSSREGIHRVCMREGIHTGMYYTGMYYRDPYGYVLQGLMRLTRLRADFRGTPTARGRQCRMSKKGQEENKNTENTQIDLNQ